MGLKGFSNDKFKALIAVIAAIVCLNFSIGVYYLAAFSKKKGAILNVFAIECNWDLF